MNKKAKYLLAAVCALSTLSGTISSFAAGYDVVTETNIPYQVSDIKAVVIEETDEYWKIIEYSNLISNFSNGYSIVYENCEEQTNDYVYFTTYESSYIIDQAGNKVDIGDYDWIGSGSLSARNTHFLYETGAGIDMFGGVNVIKNNKCGYVGLVDGVKIPCEYDSPILRYDENIFGVGANMYIGKANIFLDKTGKKLFTDIDLSPVEKEKGTFIPSIKYLGNNAFRYIYGSNEDYTPIAKYIDADGNELKDYVPTIDESQIDYTFDAELLKNFYAYDYLESGEYSLGGNKGIFINTDSNGKFGLLDKNANIIVPYIYDDICGLQDGYCWAAKDGKWSLLKISTSDMDVQLNGASIEFDQIPLIINGRTLAPVRAIFEALGATVDWEGSTQTITSTRGDTVITMSINNTEMYKNGKMITLDVAPQIIGGRTLVPVRAIAEAFDCEVTWDGATHTVQIKN